MGKGRPQDSLNRRGQQFQTFNQREPSGFERVENALRPQQLRRRGRPKGSGRMRGGAGNRRSDRKGPLRNADHGVNRNASRNNLDKKTRGAVLTGTLPSFSRLLNLCCRLELQVALDFKWQG